MSMDWEGKKFCGMDLKWDYQNRTCDLSMHGCVHKALQKINNWKPTKLRHAPSNFTPPQYGQKIQLTTTDDTKPLNLLEIKALHQVIRSFLFYGRAVDETMLHCLNSLASAQSEGTQKTKEAMYHFLDYCATHPDATIRFYASDMILKIHSDASYLTESRARSRVGGYFFLGDKQNKMYNNGAVHVIAQIIKNVVSSAAEAEIAAVFINAKGAVPLRHTLMEMNHPQPPTEITTDNSTAANILNKTCKQTRSKAIDMRYYWVRDRITQKQFCLMWKPGDQNLADYFTKHHSPAHHKKMRSTHLQLANLSMSEGVLIGQTLTQEALRNLKPVE